MTLLIDVGNSAVKWAVLAADGALRLNGRQLHRGVHDLGVRLRAAWSGVPVGGRAVGCTVAHGDVVVEIERAARDAGVAGIAWQRSQAEYAGAFVLVNGYRDPGQLGADRWHAALGACARRPAASAVVVNAGTATTVDCIDATGAVARFVGGCIAPGVRLMLESLARGTAGLPLADGEPIAFPDTTDRAIVTGVLDAQVGLIERVWRRFAARLGSEPPVVLAGGHAERLAARLPDGLTVQIDHDLVLRGLALRVAAA